MQPPRFFWQRGGIGRHEGVLLYRLHTLRTLSLEAGSIAPLASARDSGAGSNPAVAIISRFLWSS